MEHGQYYFRYLTSKSKKRLKKWTKQTLDDRCKDTVRRYLCNRLSMLRTTNTVQTSLLDDEVCVNPEHMSWKLITPSINKHLVLVVSHPVLLQRQEELIALGLTSQFKEPLLHITISKRYISDELPDLPDFDIEVREERVYQNQNQRHS